MQSQDIALNLVARLSQGDIASEAAAMGKSLSSAIEGAFDGLGERIAKKILADLGVNLQQGIGSAVGGLQFGGGVTPTQQQMEATARIERTMAGPGAQLEFDYNQSTRQAPEFIGGDRTKTFVNGIPGPAYQPPAPEPTPKSILDIIKDNKKGIMGAAGLAAGAVQLGGTIFGDMPGIERSAEASRAEIGNMGGRQLMRGQYDDLLAQQMLGGKGHIEEKARGEEMAKFAASALTTLIKDIGIGTIAGAAGGLPGMAFGAGTGLAYGASSVMKQYGQMDQNVEQNMAGQTEAERKRNAEFYQRTSRGRETGIDAFRSAQGLGAEELAPFLTGQSSRQHAIFNAGLSEQQFSGALHGFAGMGGVFGGQSAMDSQTPQINRLLTQMGQGFGGAAQVGQGMVGGGMDQGTALKTTADMFEDAVAAGMDKAKVGDALIRMSTRAESMGLGGGELARSQEREAMAMGASHFGANVQDSQLRAEERTTQFMHRTAGQGIDYTGAIRGLRAGGLNLRGKDSPYLEREFASHQIDAQGLQQMAGQHKDAGIDEMVKKLAPGPLTEQQRYRVAAEKLEASRVSGQQEMREKSLGRAGGFALAEEISPSGSLAGFATAEAGVSSFRAGKGTPGDIGVQVPHAGMAISSGQADSLKAAAIAQAAGDAVIVSSGLKSLAEQLPIMLGAFQQLNASLKTQNSGAKTASAPFLNLSATGQNIWDKITGKPGGS